MTQTLLSILIPTVAGREEQYNQLHARILRLFKSNGQNWMVANCISSNDNGRVIYSECELVYYKDDKSMTIGEKREWLYNHAKGIYSMQIDDDDDISDNAIELILDVIKVYELNLPSENIDCITFEEHISIDGKIEKSNHSLTYGDWEGEGGKELWDGFHYHRTPFFKSVIKTEIARSVPIPHIRFGEDHQWAQALKPHLKTEIHIPEQLYKYIHISTPHNERYGFDK